MSVVKRTQCAARASELDLMTIRRRVASIKSHWSPEVAQARATEGARRRRELDFLVTQLLQQMRDEQACDSSEDAHGLTLVG